MFDNSYFEWNKTRSKEIVTFYGYKFFYFKRILDLGCGYGDLGGVLYRLGADLTAVDARQEHLKIVNKKYTGIKTVQANLDVKWPFHGQKFDLILDLGLLCHLADYESHLKMVCTSTTHLVLETATCDSDDPQKVIHIDEDRSIYDLSYNGKGCRPSASAIERVLRDNGMNFKRVDNTKFNGGGYTYDWYPNNDNSTNLQKRRIWFAVKEGSPVQFQNPGSEIATAPIVIPFSPQGYITPIISSGIPAITSASPKPPISARMEAEAKARIAATNPSNIVPPNLSPSPIHTYRKSTLNEKVRTDSREFALITPDNFSPPTISQLGGIITTNTVSARMWYKKVSPFFPNLKLSKHVLAMPGFSKVDKVPDIVMCSLDNLQSYNRIWIDEWFGTGLNEEHIKLLEKSHTIITPSLLNAQEIWKYIPHANVFRMTRPWPSLEVPSADGDYYLYLEKSPTLTQLLLEAWDSQFGNLVVIGSSLKLPSFATFVSDTESYVQIIKFVMGAKALIDLSENNYYTSGINKLAQGLSLPIITNNHIRLGEGVFLISQDKEVSIYPTANDIKNTIVKFTGTKHSKTKTNIIEYNNIVIEGVRKIIGI